MQHYSIKATLREFKIKAFWRAILVELVGMTFFIIFCISTAIGNIHNTNPDQEVKVSLVFGLVIGLLVHISGAHLNPAVTLGMLVRCQMSVLKAAMYIVAQMLGSTLASGIVYGVRPSTINALGVNALNGITPGQGFVIEFLATFQLVLCAIMYTDKRRCDVTVSAPLVIGSSITLAHLATISYTGCGINPARSFGPALVTNNFTNHWVYWVGPMCGGVAAALVYDFLLYPKRDDFPARLEVLLGMPVGDSNVNGGTTVVEMSTQ